jgi:uncharacterized OB-fold protein
VSAAAVRDERSAPFFDALADGRLLIRRCVPHGHLSAPDVMFCAECGSADLDWADASGEGHIVTWTAIHGRPDETGVSAVNAVVGIVELVEGPWLLAPLLCDDGAEPRVGAGVVLGVLDGDGEPIPAFRPSGAP